MRRFLLKKILTNFQIMNYTKIFIKKFLTKFSNYKIYADFY